MHYTSLVAEAMGLPPRVETYKRLHQAADPEAAFEEFATVTKGRGLSEQRLRQTLNTHFGPK